MLDAFIKKHSRLCAIVTVLLCFVAAPYLIPENPDSAVFRSGTLSLVLMLACLMPLEHAYAHHTFRELLYGFF